MEEDNFDIRHANRLDNPGRLAELRARELLEGLAGLTEGNTCVDFGSGTGVYSLPALEIVCKNGVVYAVDNSDSLLEHLKGLTDKANLITVHKDVKITGLEDEIADVCLTAFILHEVPQPGTVIREAYRLLKPGGRLVVVEWKAELESPGPPSRSRISQEKISEMCAQAGIASLSYTDWSANYYIGVGIK